MADSTISIHDKYMEQACIVSSESSCLKRRVGAVIVKNNVVLSKCANGGNPLYINCGNYNNSLNYCYWKHHAYKTIENDESLQYEVIKQSARQLCLSICAEKRAILLALQVNPSLNGASLYCTTYPCPSCAKMIREMQLSSVFYIHDFDPLVDICRESKRIFDEANIQCIKLKPPKNMELAGTRTEYEYL